MVRFRMYWQLNLEKNGKKHLVMHWETTQSGVVNGFVQKQGFYDPM